MHIIDTNKINELRQSYHMSKRHLGRLIGYQSEGSIYYLFSSGVVRSRSKVLALCRALRCEPEDILLHPAPAIFKARFTEGRLF